MRACRFIVTNRFMHGILHMSSMLSEGILCYGLLLLLLSDLSNCKGKGCTKRHECLYKGTSQILHTYIHTYIHTYVHQLTYIHQLTTIATTTKQNIIHSYIYLN